MKRTFYLLVLACWLSCAGLLCAQVPQLISYQGRVAVAGANYSGSGLFKFALVNGPSGTTTYWSNDGTSVAGGQPTNAVTLTVSNGLYSLLLGDTTLTNMTAVPNSVFSNSDVRLRIWFNDGTNGWQQFTPDQRIASVAYAVMAGGVTTGAITSSMIASGAVGNTQLAANAVQASNISPGAVGSSQLSTITSPGKVDGAALTNLANAPAGAGLLPATNLPDNIPDSHLATISTAGKVSGTALTSLASTPSGAGVIPVANLATGTPNGSKFVRDDGTLAVPSPPITNLFGTPLTRTVGTIYQAATDGFLIGYTLRTNNNSGFRIYSDTSPTPTTLAQEGYHLWVSGGGSVSMPINFPISKGSYYYVKGLDVNKNEDNSGIQTLKFLPLGQ